MKNKIKILVTFIILAVTTSAYGEETRVNGKEINKEILVKEKTYQGERKDINNKSNDFSNSDMPVEELNKSTDASSDSDFKYEQVIVGEDKQVLDSGKNTNDFGGKSNDIVDLEVKDLGGAKENIILEEKEEEVTLEKEKKSFWGYIVAGLGVVALIIAL